MLFDSFGYVNSFPDIEFITRFTVNDINKMCHASE